MSRLFLSLFVVLGFSSLALASDITLVGGITSGNLSSDLPNTSVSSKSGIGYGALLHIMTKGGKLGFTGGFLYAENAHTVKATSTTDEVLPYYQIPVTVDYWFAPAFSLGAGGYYATSAGDAKETQNGSSTTMSFKNAGWTSSDYGLLAKAELHIMLGARWFFDVTGMYEYGLTNILDVTTGGYKVTTSNLLALGGFGIMF